MTELTGVERTADERIVFSLFDLSFLSPNNAAIVLPEIIRVNVKRFSPSLLWLMVKQPGEGARVVHHRCRGK